MIKSTFLGGLVFLLPVVFVAIVLGKAYAIARTVAEPLGALVPVDRIGGVALADLLAIAIIILVCLLAGLAARLSFFTERMMRLDRAIVGLVPGYAVARSTLSGVAETGEESDLQPVLVHFDDHEMIAFEVERTADFVVVFLPGAPSTWSGSSAIVSPDRVTRLDLPVHQVAGLLRVLGRGTVATLARAPLAAVG